MARGPKWEHVELTLGVYKHHLSGQVGRWLGVSYSDPHLGQVADHMHICRSGRICQEMVKTWRLGGGQMVKW